MPDPNSTTTIPLAPRGPVTRLFVGSDGVRAPWSVVIFAGVALVTAIVWLPMVMVVVMHVRSFPIPSAISESGPMSPTVVALPAILLLVPVLVATTVMGLIEGRSPWRYGFGDRHALRHFGAGLAWGFLALSALVGLLIVSGHLTLAGITETTPIALRYAVQWGCAFFSVGLFEESLSRGYLQATLTRGFGFWPAAVLLSVLFGAAHYGNPGESPIGLIGAGAAGFVFCYSLWRSGSLWWGIGFHTTWDWAQSYFYGTADSATVSLGRLHTAQPMGADWLSGGKVGPEGSVLVFVVLLAVIVVIRWTLRPPPGATDTPAPGT
jgi:membrane protease YdiL (CAAX protease family)